MAKKFIILIFFIFLTFTCCACNNQPNNTMNSTNFEKTALHIQLPKKEKKEIETELSSFSTEIKSKGAGRLNNIRVSCSKINNQILEIGQEFSFEKIVGQAGPDQGYQKADIFVGDKIIQAYGGGNCQVSTTLYNAVLAVSGLTVTERNPHGRKVDYVPEGKDAAVSFGSLDFKFKNDTANKIKIYATSDDATLTIKIVKIEE